MLASNRLADSGKHRVRLDVAMLSLELLGDDDLLLAVDLYAERGASPAP